MSKKYKPIFPQNCFKILVKRGTELNVIFSKNALDTSKYPKNENDAKKNSDPEM